MPSVYCTPVPLHENDQTHMLKLLPPVVPMAAAAAGVADCDAWQEAGMLPRNTDAAAAKQLAALPLRCAVAARRRAEHRSIVFFARFHGPVS